MKELKNIDRLFQEKFRDFEQTPPDHVWKNISASLSGKTKNNNRALWLWFSGIAAGLAILFLINNPFTQTNEAYPAVTETNDATSIKSLPTNSEVTNSDKNVIITDKTINTTNKQKEITYRNNTTLSKTTTKQLFSNKNTQNNVTVNANTNGSTNNSNKLITPVVNKVKVNNPIASNENISSDKSKSITINVTTPDLKENTNHKEKNSSTDTKEKQVIATNTTKETSKTLPKEALTNHTQENVITSNSSNKWTVSTTVAPVYFDVFDNTNSSFGSRFDENTKQGQFSTAYGVQLAYQVNNRFSIQTGIHKVDYGYKTNEVYVSLNKFADNKNSSIVLNDIVNIKDFHAPPNQFGVTNDISSGSLLQVLGYYEIPLELKYKLVKGKLGVDIISGFSTLIRNKDEVYYQFDDFSEKIDETSNLNSINLTGNIGLEANYKISKNIYFNITPMFKVHTNTFTKESGKSNPYAIGVYSGLNYRF